MFQSVQKVWKRFFHKNEVVKASREFLVILDYFFRNQERWLSGADVMRDIKPWSGTVYPLVIRMVDGGWLQRWRVADGRHVFKLNSDVVEQVKDMLAKNVHVWQSPKPVA